MTGFGTGKAEDSNREISIELKTVNNRYLDINLRMPRALSFLEDEIRKKIQQMIARGRVEMYVTYQNNSQEQISVSVNEPVAEAYYNALTALAQKFHMNTKPDLTVLNNIDNIFIVEKPEEDEELLKNLIFNALDEALNAVIEMRKKEGKFLAEDIEHRSFKIEQMVKEIEERSSVVVEEYRQKLEQRIKELIKNTEIDEARFQMEVAYFADRSNITEEIVRIKSHLVQLRNTLKHGGSIGRKLDFIVQELNRETNTIGSKSSDINITNYVVEIKSELEKIREQVQNIE